MMSFERFNIKLVYEYNSTSFNFAKSYCGLILGSFESSMGTFWFLLEITIQICGLNDGHLSDLFWLYGTTCTTSGLSFWG